MPPYRILDKKRFRQSTVEGTKKRAQRTAEKIRKKGYFVRVLKIKGGWGVFTRYKYYKKYYKNPWEFARSSMINTEKVLHNLLSGKSLLNRKSMKKPRKS